MTYDFSQLEQKGEEVLEWLRKECAGLRTGRATPAILDRVTIESYGMRMPLNQVATITVEDPKTLLITPWDAGQVKDVEKALRDADLGLSVNTGDTGLRVSFPDLTTERRTTLIKVLRQKEEQAKVSLRTEREKVWDDIQSRERSGEISEDDKFRFKEKMQAIIDDMTKKIESHANDKERDIREQ